jgi:dolichyl-phosphate beta-glucosyltransferase
MPTLTIVIPAFDEENKITLDVQAAARFLSSHSLDGEIIVADDGSSDRTFDRASAASIPPGIHRTVIRSDSHRGKGWAVRAGILASRGDYVMFADCGCTVPLDNALAGLRLLREQRCDLAHGSRHLAGSIIRRDRDWDRRMLSAAFHAFVIHWMGLPASLTDTQCGFKLYRGDVARTLYTQCSTDGFMFDIEVILRALREGFRITEFPVEWSCDRDSRLGLRHSARQVLKELLHLKRTLVLPPPQGRTEEHPHRLPRRRSPAGRDRGRHTS